MEYTFAFTGSQSIADNASVEITVTGVAIKNDTYVTWNATARMLASSDNLPASGSVDESANKFYVNNISGSTATVTYVAITGSVLLNAEPTWASLGTTAAAALEGVLPVDVYIAPATATSAGLVDTQAQSFAGNKTLTGFTSLGSGNSGLKCKILTGTSAAAEGGAVNIAHGLTGDKIVGFTCKLTHVTNQAVPPHFVNAAGYDYELYHSDTNFTVYNHATSSENILSKPLTIMVWYIE
jgi:hypothetical protein